MCSNHMGLFVNSFHLEVVSGYKRFKNPCFRLYHVVLLIIYFAPYFTIKFQIHCPHSTIIIFVTLHTHCVFPYSKRQFSQQHLLFYHLDISSSFGWAHTVGNTKYPGREMNILSECNCYGMSLHMLNYCDFRSRKVLNVLFEGSRIEFGELKCSPGDSQEGLCRENKGEAE